MGRGPADPVTGRRAAWAFHELFASTSWGLVLDAGGRVLASGTGREPTRGDGAVIELVAGEKLISARAGAGRDAHGFEAVW
jgi:hypothetical protein